MKPNLIKKIVVFILLFSLLNVFFPHMLAFKQEEAYISEETTVTELIKEELKMYSTFYNQTMNDSKLANLSTDFYVPTTFLGETITWVIDSEYIEISNEVEVISIQTLTGYEDISVYLAHIVTFPSVFAGNKTLILQANLLFQGEPVELTYSIGLSPVMPTGFFPGSVFTFVRYVSLFIEGVITTLSLSLIGTIIGFVLSLILVGLRIAKPNPRDPKWLRLVKSFGVRFSKLYVTIFRGTPMIVQASFFWYGLGLFGNAILCGLFVVSINTAAYIAEILRGGIESIDQGQTEASRSLGMTNIQTLLFVIFPQAIKNSMPAIGNEFVINIKDTAVLSVIGIFELFNQTKRIAGMHYRQLEAYFVVALIYLFLTYTITYILQRIEKRLDMPVKELTSSN